MHAIATDCLSAYVVVRAQREDDLGMQVTALQAGIEVVVERPEDSGQDMGGREELGARTGTSATRDRRLGRHRRNEK